MFTMSRVLSRTRAIKITIFRNKSCNYSTIWVELYKTVFTIGNTQFSLLYKDCYIQKSLGIDSLAGKVFAMFIRTWIRNSEPGLAWNPTSGEGGLQAEYWGKKVIQTSLIVLWSKKLSQKCKKWMQLRNNTRSWPLDSVHLQSHLYGSSVYTNTYKRKLCSETVFTLKEKTDQNSNI